MLSKIINFYHLFFIYIGIDYKIKFLNIENKLIKVIIYDTAVQGRIRKLSETYYKGAQGVIYMYDIADQITFKTVNNWIKDAEENGYTNAPKVLIGNNCEKPDRKVTEEEGKKLADDFNMGFFETSPKTNQNVNESMYYLVREILKVEEGNKIKKNINIKNEYNSGNKKKCA